MTNPISQPLQNHAPFSQEAEEALLGAVLLDPGTFLNIASFLEPDDFFLKRHEYVWHAFSRLQERNDPMDYVTVSQELHDMDVLDEIGGQAFLTYLVNNTPSSVHAEVYGRLVERAAIRRKMLEATDEIRKLAMDEEIPIDKVISDAEQALFNVSDSQVKREFVPLWQAVSDYYDDIEKLLEAGTGLVGIPTGFKALDGLLGGFQKSDLIVFAGRPGMGKTSWLLTVALNIARQFGARVALFTMEMGVEQMVQRLISMETGIRIQQLRTADLSASEHSRFTEAVGRIANLPIFIDDTPAINPIEMRTKCRRLQHEYGLDMVIVDYMQLMSAGKAYENNRVQEISYISRSLKELARELNVTVLSAAQLSRAVEQRQDKRPQLSDLRESGCLAGETQVYLPDLGYSVPIESLVGQKDFRVLSLNTDTWKLEYGTVTNAFCTGVKPVYRMTTALGRTIRATANHKFLTIDGWKRLDALTMVDSIAVPTQYTTQLQTETVTENRVQVRKMQISDVYWDKIVSIEPDGETAVYDLTVDTYHNFCADLMIVHNSIEQDADAVMFLYRDEVYNPETTEFPNQADVLLSKHRHGPTGTISLYFEKSITKFMDVNMQRVDLSDLE